MFVFPSCYWFDCLAPRRVDRRETRESKPQSRQPYLRYAQQVPKSQLSIWQAARSAQYR